MRYLRRERGDVEANLDISPLIDMVFILLIFFMVSTTFVKDMNLELTRPSAQSASRASSKAIRVFIDRAGTAYLDDVPVKPWMIQSRVRELLKSGASGDVLVVTDVQVPAEKLIAVVDQCRLAGADHVGVATRAEAG
ncbi:MAG: biopolymer transporter ExbD [Myxococcales bacterium]|nr:biopolymer transporter ExbD [Myxococcales bacterium]MCB9737050.1 biopolymer transporter ExbD [Deltaproteobacteria bacterium]